MTTIHVQAGRTGATATSTTRRAPLRERHYAVTPRTRILLAFIAVLGGLCFLAGLSIAPGRAWGGFLMGFFLFTSLAVAGPLFIALLTLSGARWSSALQRVPEAMAGAVPTAAVLGLLLIFGLHDLYEWSHTGLVARDHLLQHKSPWLNQTDFALRLVIILVSWVMLSRSLVARSRRHAETGARFDAVRKLRSSALFVAVFAITFSVACFDWLMSLEPHWFSTMFALMHLGGLAAAGTAAAALLVLALERQGALRGVLREEHLHDLGKLLFSLTLFWAYCWYCQYMLIWYTDIPEETSHYLLRKHGSWWLLVQAALVVKWGVPFLALLARRACRSRAVIGRIAVVVLAGHALDLYVQVGPSLMGGEPRFGLWELGPVVGALALFFLIALGVLSRGPAVPTRHPHLPDSLSYHTP